ncbi:hypothetical protein Tco_0661721 [Tanacetum coccineum]
MKKSQIRIEVIWELGSQPMVWIGIYIAIASLVCTLAMAADLLHGLRSKKFMFPCKFFTLNAASITVITVATKLPVDLTSVMPADMDQAAKLGSLAFMCTIMVNLMPSLASMDSKTLLANVIGLSILVITVIVNVIIQIQTWIIDNTFPKHSYRYISILDCAMAAYIYAAMILLLLIIMISSSLTIPTSKEILEFKYQATNKTSSIDQQQTQMSLVEKLRQHVRRFWVMAETGSPQFVMVSNPLSTASGVICVFVLLMQTLIMFEFLYGYHGYALKDALINRHKSVYKWSILFILVTQSIGVVVGTIAPMFRCFSVLSFKLVTKWDMNHLMVFKVEKYWTQKLYEWKQSIGFQKTGKEQNSGLLELLEQSTGFDGVEQFDTDHIQPLHSVELVNSWSLPIVTLTCIVVALPRIPKDRVKTLVKSVGEGHYEPFGMTVEKQRMWLKNSLSKNAFEGKTATEILKWFADKAEEIFNKSSNGIMVENNIPKELIASNSMYRIAQSILLREHGNAEPLRKKQLFALLNGMIADILSACSTNIPQVITMKCHESVIEKRQASVRAAAELLGKTKKILERLETFELPSLYNNDEPDDVVDEDEGEDLFNDDIIDMMRGERVDMDNGGDDVGEDDEEANMDEVDEEMDGEAKDGSVVNGDLPRAFFS